MSEIKDGGAAFPVPSDGSFGTWAGMSLRDWLAGQAMAALINHSLGCTLSHGAITGEAYALADAMLERRLEKL